MMRNIGIAIIFLLMMPFGYAQSEYDPVEEDIYFSDSDCELVEPPVDGIYRMENITIRYIPPRGWKTAGEIASIAGDVFFTPSCEEMLEGMNGITISVYHGVIPAEDEWIDDLEATKEAAMEDETFISIEIIDFLDAKALMTTITMAGGKSKQIQFVKDGNLFVINYFAFENFDTYLAAFDSSLESFKIVSFSSEDKD